MVVCVRIWAAVAPLLPVIQFTFCYIDFWARSVVAFLPSGCKGSLCGLVSLYFDIVLELLHRLCQELVSPRHFLRLRRRVLVWAWASVISTMSCGGIVTWWHLVLPWGIWFSHVVAVSWCSCVRNFDASLLLADRLPWGRSSGRAAGSLLRPQ